MRWESTVTRHGNKYPELNGVRPWCPECDCTLLEFLGTWEETKETLLSVLGRAFFGIEPKKTGRVGMEFECRVCSCRFEVYFNKREW